MVCWNPTPSDTSSDSDSDLTVPFGDNTTEEGDQDADFVLSTGSFSEDPNGEEWIRCAKYFIWADKLRVGMETILFVSHVRYKHCFVLFVFVIF